MPLNHKDILIPDPYGEQKCTKCGGYGWTHGEEILPSFEIRLTHEDCFACKGAGHFSSVTIVGENLDFDYARLHQQLLGHLYKKSASKVCPGVFLVQATKKGVRFRCESCRELTRAAAHHKAVQKVASPPPITMLQARGGHLLSELRKAIV